MQGNTLFPIFLKLDQLNVLVVGGGNVGLEKLTALLINSPKSKIMLVADTIQDEIYTFLEDYPQVVIAKRKYKTDDLNNKDLAILATNDRTLHEQIKKQATEKGVLANVADTPDLCDFYLGSIVKKGDLKIAISTNGKSPTLAKRMRQYFESAISDDIQDVLDNLHEFRNRLKGDFQHKVKELNKLTSGMLNVEK